MADKKKLKNFTISEIEENLNKRGYSVVRSIVLHHIENVISSYNEDKTWI